MTSEFNKSNYQSRRSGDETTGTIIENILSFKGEDEIDIEIEM
jgi:hypothetical protein